MKKNLISVVILALVFANFVLTALLMFSVLPETKKANTLIEKVCSAIDLDLNSGAATGTSNVSIDDQEIYKVSTGEDLTTNLAEGKDGKTHYAVLNVSLVLNKKSDNYKKYTQEQRVDMPYLFSVGGNSIYSVSINAPEIRMIQSKMILSK